MRPKHRVLSALLVFLTCATLLAGCAVSRPAASPSASAPFGHGELTKKKIPKRKTVQLPVSDCSLLPSMTIAAAAGDGASVSAQSDGPAAGGTRIEACLYEAAFPDRLEGIDVQVARFADGRGAKHLTSMSVLLPGSGSVDGFDVTGLPEPVRTAVGSLAKTTTAAAETSVGPYVMWVSTTGQPSAAAAADTVSTLLTALVAKARG